MQTVEKPNFFVVPQLAQTVFEGKRANFFTFFSAALDDIFYMSPCTDLLDGVSAVIGMSWCIDVTAPTMKMVSVIVASRCSFARLTFVQKRFLVEKSVFPMTVKILHIIIGIFGHRACL
jgi:hypothetical protein